MKFRSVMLLAALALLGQCAFAQGVVTALRNPPRGGSGISVTCATGAGSSVVATFAAGTNQISLEGCYVTGLTNNAVDVMDNTGASFPTGTSWHSGSMTTGNANDVVFGYVLAANNVDTFAATSPWVLGNTATIQSTYSAAIVYQIVSSTGSYQPTGTGSTSNSMVAIGGAYK